MHKNKTNNLKNFQIAFPPGGQKHRVRELLIKDLTFIQKTMDTLSEFNKQLKTQFDIDLTLKEKVINLSKYLFSKATYKLLNKKLNFLPTQKNTRIVSSD